MNALPVPALMLVTDRTLTGDGSGLVAQVERAVAGGVNLVQLREKELPDNDLRELGLRLRRATVGRALLLVNGPPALAAAIGADGVHLAEDALAIGAVKRATRGRLLVGRSVHSLDAAQRAADDGADYLVLGTIFASRSHPGGETGGMALIEQVTKALRTPVIAIGGITTHNTAEVVGAGASGIAVISAILGQPDPRAAAHALHATLDNAWQARAAHSTDGGTGPPQQRRGLEAAQRRNPKDAQSAPL
jgi:thiamine-phosphate diphosphorylase